MPPARNVLFITLDQWRGDCLSALGHPVLETPTLDASGRRGRAVRQPLGQRGAVRALASLPLHRHVSAPQPLAAQRHPARRPVHQRGARWRASLGYDPVLFGYTDTSVDPRTVPPGDPRLFSYEGVLPGLPRPGRGPLGAGEPGVGTLARRARRRRPAPTRTTCTSRWRGSRGPTTTGRPGRRPASRRSSRRRRSSAESVVEWLERNGGRAVLRPRLLHPSPPAAAEPDRVSRPLPGRGRRAVRRAARRPRRRRRSTRSVRWPWRSPASGASRRRAGAPADSRHLLRRTARGGRRVGAAVRVPGARAGWPSRPWSSSPATTARWAATTGCSRSSATGTRATTSR